MVILSVVWEDPKVAANWVAKLVAKLNGTLRLRAIEKADMNTRFLKKQLDETSNVELRQAVFRLIEDQIRNKMLAHVQVEYAFTVVDPPVVADPDDYVVPRRILYVIGGGFLGLLIGFSIILILSFKQAQNRPT